MMISYSLDSFIQLLPVFSTDQRYRGLSFPRSPIRDLQVIDSSRPASELFELYEINCQNVEITGNFAWTS